MHTGREWLYRLLATFRRRRTDADLEAELQAHLQLAEEDAERRGRTPAEAARGPPAGRRRVTGAGCAPRPARAADDGGRVRRRREPAEARAAAPRLLHLRHAHPRLAVGVNLVVFTIVNALWLRPLPFPDADRLVSVIPPFIGFARLDGPLVPELRPHRSRRLPATRSTTTSGDWGGPVPRLAVNGREVETLGVTAEHFGLLGVPVRGRDFTSVDDRPGAEPVAIISDRLWSREFGRRADVIGAVVPAGPLPVRIVGIAPAKFEARGAESARMSGFPARSCRGRAGPPGTASL